MMLHNWHVLSKPEPNFCVCCSGNDSHVQSSKSLVIEAIPAKLDNEEDSTDVQDQTAFRAIQTNSKVYKNRFLNFVRLSSVVNNAAESFFKSEIRRRLFVTAALLILSRVGYFIPLPGFDRRLIPQDYLKFVSGSVGKTHIMITECFSRYACTYCQ